MVTVSLGAPSHDAVPGVSADQHHTEEHALADHTGRTHAALITLTADDHHTEVHTHAGYRFLGAVTIDDDATIDIEGLTVTPKSTKIIGSGITFAADGASLFCQMGDSGGVDVGVADYEWWMQRADPSGTAFAASADASDAAIRVSQGSGLAVTEGGGFEMMIPHANNSGQFNIIQGFSTVFTQTPALAHAQFSGGRKAAITLTTLRFFASSGNLKAGTIEVWELIND